MSRNRRRAAPRVKPTNVEGLWTTRTAYYREQLETKILGLFDVECEDDWNTDYFLWLLCFEGLFVITDTAAGVLPFRCTTSGVNYMNLATHALINVPMFPQMERRLNEECVLIYLRQQEKMFYNYRMLVDTYAERLASADACIDVNLMNSRAAYFVEAETKAQAETIKAIYDDVTNGEPLVVARKGTTSEKVISEGMNVFFNNLKNNYIANDVLDTKRSIMNEFLTELGINNANTDKKERLLTGEVDSNNDELANSIEEFSRNLKRQCDMVHKLYPDIKFDIKFKFNALNKKAEVNNNAVNGGTNAMGMAKSTA